MSNTEYEDGPAPGISWDDYATVMASDYRQRVLKQMDDPITPTELSGALDLKISHVSRTLSKLREMGFVDLLVSEDTQKGRYYGRTDAGERLTDALENND